MSFQLKNNILLALLGLSSAACLAQTCEFKQLAQLPVSWSEGGMQPIVDGYIDGIKVPMLIDTGASHTYLTSHTVRMLGLPLGDTAGHSYGVGGVNDIYSAIVNDFSVGSYSLRGYMKMLSDMPGAGGYGAIVGADMLMRGDMEVWLAGKQVNLFRAKDCDKVFLGYWDKDAMEVPMIRYPGDRRPFVTVELNGVKIDAVVDTGASTSVVTLKAAEKAGLKIDPRTAAPTGKVNGIGKHSVKTWQAKFQFKLGDELIQNAPLTVVEQEFSIFNDASILLGQDWLLAHRVMFVRSQMRMVYSYLGGEVFASASAQPWYAKEAEAGQSGAQYAMALHAAKQNDAAASEQWLKKAAAQGHVNALVLLGRSALSAQHYAAAEAYFQAGLTQEPGNTYLALWLYLSQVRTQGASGAAANLLKFSSADGDYWPHALLSFYLGRGSAKTVREDAKKYGQDLCMAESFIRSWYSAQSDEASLKTSEQFSTASCGAG